MEKAVTQDTTKESDQAETKYAGFWMRVVASFIDSFVTQMAFFVLYIAGFMIYAIASGDFNAEMLEEDSPVDQEAEITVAELVIIFSCMSLFAMYYIIMNATKTFKGTLGKYALDMQVLDLDGNKISYMRSFWRYFFAQIAFLLALFTFGLPYIIVVFNKRKRALHDFLAGTMVVRKY